MVSGKADLCGSQCSGQRRCEEPITCSSFCGTEEFSDLVQRKSDFLFLSWYGRAWRAHLTDFGNAVPVMLEISGPPLTTVGMFHTATKLCYSSTQSSVRGRHKTYWISTFNDFPANDVSLSKNLSHATGNLRSRPTSSWNAFISTIFHGRSDTTILTIKFDSMRTI